jgi:GNAT superfamily N-acetyltransferase
LELAIVQFVVGYDFESFKEYYRSLHDLHEFYKLHGTGFNCPELGDDEARHIMRNPDYLIMWMEGPEIVGHTIWHETTTDEMAPDDPRTEPDKLALRALFGGAKANLVELHEVWLRTEHRGKGYGRQFFVFFEEFARERGYAGIVYYTDTPAAIALCRKMGYREAPEPIEGEWWYVFVKSLTT